MPDAKVDEMKAKVKFRDSVAEMMEIALATCEPGQSIEDFVGVLKLSLSNDLLLKMLMDKVTAHVAGVRQ